MEHEWEIEQVLEANAATVSVIGLSLARFGSRRWLVLPMAVGALLLQHAHLSAVPPIGCPHAEIDEERYALKVLRGDFKAVEGTGSPSAQEVLQAIRA